MQSGKNLATLSEENSTCILRVESVPDLLFSFIFGSEDGSGVLLLNTAGFVTDYMALYSEDTSFHSLATRTSNPTRQLNVLRLREAWGFITVTKTFEGTLSLYWVSASSFVRNNVSACFIKHVYHNMFRLKSKPSSSVILYRILNANYH
jgi:hypothetical protein